MLVDPEVVVPLPQQKSILLTTMGVLGLTALACFTLLLLSLRRNDELVDALKIYKGHLDQMPFAVNTDLDEYAKIKNAIRTDVYKPDDSEVIYLRGPEARSTDHKISTNMPNNTEILQQRYVAMMPAVRAILEGGSDHNIASKLHRQSSTQTNEDTGPEPMFLSSKGMVENGDRGVAAMLNTTVAISGQNETT